MASKKQYSAQTQQWAQANGLDRVEFKDQLGQVRIKYVKSGKSARR